MGFLDSSGLSHFWDKVKLLLNKKQDALTPDTGISLSNNVISVETPVKGLTKVEYDALTDEEKNSGLYILTDVDNQVDASGATFTPSVSDEGVISWTNDKGLPNPGSVNIKGPRGELGPVGPKGEDISGVYSTTETRIGTWIDGKPLYRVVIGMTTANANGLFTHQDVSSLNIDILCALRGYMTYSSDGTATGHKMFMQVPFDTIRAGKEDGTLILFYNGGTRKLSEIHTNSFNSCRMTLILEYTKTTDAAPASQTTLLTSEVDLPETLSVSYAPASASSAKL